MPTFPALDEEPPPRPLWQVLVIVAAGAVVVAAIVVGVVVRPWPSGATGGPSRTGARSAALSRVGGRVLVLDYLSGRFGYTAPDGTHFTPLAGGTASGRFAQVSPDGSMAVTDSGLLVRFSRHRAAVSSAEPPAQQNTLMPTSFPWADHGQRLVLMTVGGGHADVSTVDVDGRDVHALGGGANDAAGDPTRDGALVMVAGHKLVNMGAYGELPTVRLELRTPGHSSLFETTAGLATEAGLPTTVPYRVTAEFSPDGTMVAVSLDQLRPGPGAAHGLVVLSRGATNVFATKSGSGIWFSWAQDGHRLAFGSDGNVSVVGFNAMRAQVERISVGDPDLAPCLWSPQQSDLLCDDYQSSQRYVVELASRKVVGPIPLQAQQRYALAWQPGKAA